MVFINKYSYIFIVIVCLCCFRACIEPYDAEIDEQTGVLTIDGSIIKGDTIQTISITRSSTLKKPDFDPVSTCVVWVESLGGEKFIFPETAPGIYQCTIQEEKLKTEEEYWLVVHTPDGEVYESFPETMYKGIAVDSIYYELEDRYTVENGTIEGAQIYIDIDGKDEDTRYYRWKLTETWEFTSVAPIDIIYEDKYFVAKSPLDSDTLFRCWRTEPITKIYTSSTINLQKNEKKQIPLEFISTLTERLRIKYCLKVEQYSMNEKAFRYWEHSKSVSGESGDLYSQQPTQPSSNVYCSTRDEEKILGYFWVSEKSEEYFFIKRPEELVVYHPCKMWEFNRNNSRYGPFPIYISLSENNSFTSYYSCFDCTLREGSVNKPDFWQ